MSEAEYSLILAFPDESPSFAHGFEAGLLYQRLLAGETPIEDVAHAENREVVSRMAERCGYECRLEEAEVEGWLTVRLEKKRYLPPPRNPYGLRVVKRGNFGAEKEQS